MKTSRWLDVVLIPLPLLGWWSSAHLPRPQKATSVQTTLLAPSAVRESKAA